MWLLQTRSGAQNYRAGPHGVGGGGTTQAWWPCHGSGEPVVKAASSPMTCHLLVAPKRSRQILGKNAQLDPRAVPKGRALTRLRNQPPVPGSHRVSPSLPQTLEDKTGTNCQTPNPRLRDIPSCEGTCAKASPGGQAVGDIFRSACPQEAETLCPAQSTQSLVKNKQPWAVTPQRVHYGLCKV